MTDYYRVDSDGSIFLILESKIISEGEKTITVKDDGYTRRRKKKDLWTNFDEAKKLSQSIIASNIERLKQQIEIQESNLDRVNWLDDNCLRVGNKYNAFFTK